jgi:hypothetical protein
VVKNSGSKLGPVGLRFRVFSVFRGQFKRLNGIKHRTLKTKLGGASAPPSKK